MVGARTFDLVPHPLRPPRLCVNNNFQKCRKRTLMVTAGHQRNFNMPPKSGKGSAMASPAMSMRLVPRRWSPPCVGEPCVRRGVRRGATPCLPLGHSQWVDIRSGPTLPASSAPLRKQSYLKDANQTPAIIRSWTSVLLPPAIMQKTRKAQSSDAPMERRTRKTALREGQNRKAVPRYTAWLLRRSSSRRARRSRSER